MFPSKVRLSTTHTDINNNGIYFHQATSKTSQSNIKKSFSWRYYLFKRRNRCCKTTFSRFLIHHIQEKNKIKQEEVVSPTFNIVQYYYITKKLHIAHYDLYRIKKAKDLMNTGLYNQEEFFLNIIEWPELIKKKNKNRIEIVLKHTKNNDLRKYNVKYFGRFKK